MLQNNKVIAFIPVRGGSKSIPGKNIKPINGKPLLYWSALACERAESVDEIIIATDDMAIKQTALNFQFSKLSVYMRDEGNAQDDSSTESVMLEYLKKVAQQKEDKVILVQATNPFLEAKHIEESLDSLSKYDSIISCVLFKRFIWDKNGGSKNYDFRSRPRRQDFDGDYLENGAFYINTVESIIKHENRLSGDIGIYEMPWYSQFELDDPDDWKIVEHYMQKYIAPCQELQSNIKLFLTDVDGVLTDAGMYYSENGDELKKFNTLDGKGLELLRSAGIKTGIITTENTKLVENRAKKLKVDFLYQGITDKLSTVKALCEAEGFKLDEIAYIGDDINCFELLSAVGVSACPKNAVEKVKNIPGIQHMHKEGGGGVVREFSELILSYN